MYSATKEFNFEAGHCLDGYQGKCKNLHGHNYKVFVTVSASDLDKMDMVMDFYNLNTFAKPLFDEFDHAFIYNENCVDTFEKDLYEVCCKHNRKVKNFPAKATAENMAKYFYMILNRRLSESVNTEQITISKVVVYETPTSYATYEG